MTLTPGERTLFAVAFVAEIERSNSPNDAAVHAFLVVQAARMVSRDPAPWLGKDTTLAMLRDMLGEGAPLCDECGGVGSVKSDGKASCRTCGGSKVVEDKYHFDEDGLISCPECHGNGFAYYKDGVNIPCPTCHGTGPIMAIIEDQCERVAGNRLGGGYAARFTVEYVCSRCEATGVKLWRKANGADDVLFCAECGKADQKLTGEVDDDGRHDGRYGKTDQLGDLLPAVPIDDTFWGYTSVPDDGVEWWRALPTCHGTDQPTKTAGPHPSEAFNDEAAKRDAELLNATDQPGGDDET
jgi:hypothetical protein